MKDLTLVGVAQMIALLSLALHNFMYKSLVMGVPLLNENVKTGLRTTAENFSRITLREKSSSA